MKFVYVVSFNGLGDDAYPVGVYESITDVNKFMLENPPTEIKEYSYEMVEFHKKSLK